MSQTPPEAKIAVERILTKANPENEAAYAVIFRAVKICIEAGMNRRRDCPVPRRLRPQDRQARPILPHSEVGQDHVWRSLPIHLDRRPSRRRSGEADPVGVEELAAH